MTAWTRLTAELEAAPARQVGALLRAGAPHLVRQMRADRDCGTWRELWGTSWNYDENAAARIVAPGILDAVLREVACEPAGDRAHAGFLHTYGYLLSNLRTPYGTKRQRWVRPEIDQGLGLRRKCIRAEPVAGTLFANVTWLMAGLALDGIVVAEREARWVAPQLLGVDLDGLTDRRRLVERLPRGPGRPTGLELHTTLVALPGWAATGQQLLIYSYRAGARSAFRLVTVFPISADAVEALWSQPVGDRVEVGVRYNAAPPGCARGVSGRGTRSRWVAAAGDGGRTHTSWARIR